MNSSRHIDILQFEKVTRMNTSVCSGMFQLAFFLSSKEATLAIPWFLCGDALAVAKPASEYSVVEGDLTHSIDGSAITSLSSQLVNCRIELVEEVEPRLCSRHSEDHDIPQGARLFGARQCEEQGLSESLGFAVTELRDENAYPESPCLGYELQDTYPNIDFEGVPSLLPQIENHFGGIGSRIVNCRTTSSEIRSLYMEGLQVVKLWFRLVTDRTWPANAACRNLMLRDQIHFRPVDSWFALGPALEFWEFSHKRNYEKVSAWMDTINVEQVWWRRDGDLLEDRQTLMQASANYVDSWFELEQF